MVQSLHFLVSTVHTKTIVCSVEQIIKGGFSERHNNVVISCVFVVLCEHCCFFTLDAGLLARCQYSEGPATGHLDTGFS